LAKKIIISFFILIYVLGQAANLQAQDKQELDSTWNDWNFRISPFFWLIGFEGTIYRPPSLTNYPEPPPRYEIDVGFKDIKNSIKFALMLAGKFQSKHMVAQFNFSSLILESEAITPLELVLQDNIVRLNYFGGDVGIGYRAIKRPKIEFEPILGLKFVAFKIGLSTNALGNIQVNGERSKTWVDPVVGANVIYRPIKKLEFWGYGDIGPAWINNQYTYQVMASANYRFTKLFLLSIGYRYYSVEFPKKEAIYNGIIKGWVIRCSFQF